VTSLVDIFPFASPAKFPSFQERAITVQYDTVPVLLLRVGQAS